MPIIFYPTSFRKSQAFQAGLLHLVQLGRIPAGLTIYPHTLAVYNLRANDVLTNADPGATASLVSWRYFAGVDNPKTTVAGDVDASSTPKVTSLSYGASAWEALKAAEALGDVPDVIGPSSFEPRMLRIPGLLIEAFWLKLLSPGDEADLVVPYHTLIKELDPGKPYSVEEFFAVVRPFAEKAIREGDSPKTVREGSAAVSRPDQRR